MSHMTTRTQTQTQTECIEVEPKSTRSSGTELTNSDGNEKDGADAKENKLCFVCHGGSATISLLCCMVKCHLGCISKTNITDRCPSCNQAFSNTGERVFGGKYHGEKGLIHSSTTIDINLKKRKGTKKSQN